MRSDHLSRISSHQNARRHVLRSLHAILRASGGEWGLTAVFQEGKLRRQNWSFTFVWKMRHEEASQAGRRAVQPSEAGVKKQSLPRLLESSVSFAVDVTTEHFPTRFSSCYTTCVQPIGNILLTLTYFHCLDQHCPI